MKRSKLGPGAKSQERGSTFRSPAPDSRGLKRSGPPKLSAAARERRARDRDWAPARAKVAAEGRCRACGALAGCGAGLDAAHIIPRSRVRDARVMDPRNILPLCRECHAAQHRLRLVLGPLLTDAERAYVISLVGEGEARVRLYGREAA